MIMTSHAFVHFLFNEKKTKKSQIIIITLQPLQTQNIGKTFTRGQ